MQSELKFRFIPTLILLTILIFSHLHSNAQEDDMAKKPRKNWPAVIHKITDLGLPQNMVYRIRRMNKAEMDSIKGEDYHENLREGDYEYVLKVMLRFIDGKIIGFVKKEPMMQSNQGTYLTQVDIPVEWCGMDSLKTEHCVKSEEEMALLDSGVVIKPRDWHQKLDANEISTDVVNDHVDLLKLLESRTTRKKLQSKKMTDSLSHVLQKLTGDDSAYVSKKLELVTKEYKEAQRRKQGGDFIDDSTLSVITNGLTGADSLKAIKSYLATKKIEKALKGDKKYQKGVAALDSTTIASITKGLTGADSINALKNYLEPKIVKTDKKKGDGSSLDSATIANVTKGLTGADSVNAIRSYVMAEKASKSIKGKDKKITKEEQLLDSSTIASITQGLTGSDSVNAIRSYVMAAKAKTNKKGKKQVVTNPVPPDNASNSAIVNPTDSTSTTSTSSLPPTAKSFKPVKADKKKKKVVESIVTTPTEDSSLASATKGLSGADSINAIREVKLEEKRNNSNKKKDKKQEQIVQTSDSSLVPLVKTEEPPVPAIITKKEKKKKKDSQPSEKVVIDTIATPIATTSNESQKNNVQTLDSTNTNTAQKESTLKEETKQERRKKTGAITAEQVVKDTVASSQPASAISKLESDSIKNTLPTATKSSKSISIPVVPSPTVESKKEESPTKEVINITPVVKDSSKVKPAPSIEENKQTIDSLKNTTPSATKDSTSVSQPVEPPIEKKPFRKRLKVVAPPTDDSTTKHNLLIDSTSSKLPITDSTKK